MSVTRQAQSVWKTLDKTFSDYGFQLDRVSLQDDEVSFRFSSGGTFEYLNLPMATLEVRLPGILGRLQRKEKYIETVLLGVHGRPDGQTETN